MGSVQRDNYDLGAHDNDDQDWGHVAERNVAANG